MWVVALLALPQATKTASVTNEPVSIESVVLFGDEPSQETPIIDLTSRLLVSLKPGGTKVLLKGGSQKLVLFLDAHQVDGIEVRPFPGKEDQLLVELRATNENLPTLSRVIGGRFGNDGFEVELAIGTEDLSRVSLPHKVRVLTMKAPKAIVISIAALILLVVLFYLGARNSILRDHGTRSDGRLRTYSLARTQMAIWFFLIIVAFLFIWAVTGVTAPLTASVLSLIGIASGAALGSALIDDSKRASSDEAKALANYLAALATAEATQPVEAQRLRSIIASLRDRLYPPSEDFISDVLKDQNGFSLHRLQMAVWTIVLIAIFVGYVWQSLALPEFSDTYLALMGISAGTYLGFKFPEQTIEEPRPNSQRV